MTGDKLGDTLRDLLGETADDIVPGDRLDAIRSATERGRRTGRGWWAAAGAGLLAACVVTAVALSTGGTPRSSETGPATSTSPSESLDQPASPDAPTATKPGTSTVAVYYVGDTPDGPRLYREFRRWDASDTLNAAVRTAIESPPLDPDYRSAWNASRTTFEQAYVVGDVIRIEFSASGVLDVDDDSPAERALAVQQLIYTAQAAVQERLPVQFYLRGNPTAEVLGVPTSELLAAGDLLRTLALVSISDPSEGLEVDNDEPFTVKGAGNSYEGNVVTRIQRLDGSEVLDPLPTIAGWMEDRLFPFEVTFDLSDVPPGDYVVLSQTDDPSGEGRFHTDSRQITVID